MRYLEQCLADLKTTHRLHRDSPASIASGLRPPPVQRAVEDDGEEEKHEDEEMEDVVPPSYVEPTSTTSHHPFATAASPAIGPSDRSVYSHSTTTSPAITSRDVARFSANLSPALLSPDSQYYPPVSSSTCSPVTPSTIHPSPTFNTRTPSATRFINPFHDVPPNTGPTPAPASSHRSVHFQLTSPALVPQPDREDQEATAALLMLNTDRRSWSGPRGISVKDLLSG